MVYHDLARGTMANILCNEGNVLLRTALMTSFMRQVEKAYTCEVCDELREDSEPSLKVGAFRRSRDDGDAGGRNDNRGGVNRVL